MGNYKTIENKKCISETLNFSMEIPNYEHNDIAVIFYLFIYAFKICRGQSVNRVIYPDMSTLSTLATGS